MSAGWPSVRLGEVLSLQDNSVPTEELGEVVLAGVYSFGRGLFLRGPMSPADTTYRKYNRLVTDDFVISQPKAWEGALARVTKEYEGCFLSPVFPTFRADRSRLDPRYLEWFCRQTSVWAELQQGARGMGARRESVSPQQFLALRIALPPLAEQQRVVARIEELRERTAEVLTLRHQAAEQSGRLLAAFEMQIWPVNSLAGAPTLENVTTYLARGRQSEQGESDHFLVKTQHVQQGRYLPTQLRLAPGAASKVREEARLESEDILVACSAAGCLGRVAQFIGDSRVASTDTHVAIVRPDHNKVEPGYLYAYLRGAQGQLQLRSRERGDWQREKIGFRLTELNLADLKRVPVPLPSRAEQRRILAEVSVAEEAAAALARQQEQSLREVRALVPAILDRAFKGEL